MHEKSLNPGLARSGVQYRLVIIIIAFNRDYDGKNLEKLAEFIYFLPNLPSISLEWCGGKKKMNSFLQPISLVSFHKLHNG